MDPAVPPHSKKNCPGWQGIRQSFDEICTHGAFRWLFNEVGFGASNGQDALFRRRQSLGNKHTKDFW